MTDDAAKHAGIKVSKDYGYETAHHMQEHVVCGMQYWMDRIIDDSKSRTEFETSHLSRIVLWAVEYQVFLNKVWAHHGLGVLVFPVIVSQAKHYVMEYMGLVPPQPSLSDRAVQPMMALPPLRSPPLPSTLSVSRLLTSLDTQRAARYI